MTEAGHQQLATEIRGQVKALENNLTTEHAFTEQMMDLREVKASLNERVTMTDHALRDARLHVVNLEQKDKQQSRQINMLEAKLEQRPQRNEDFQTLLHIQELDNRNKDLERQLADSMAKVSSLTENIKEKSTGFENLQSRVSETLSQLAEAHRQVQVGRDEKSLCEQQANDRHENLRKELTASAETDLANLRNELQAKPKGPSWEAKCNHVTKHFFSMRAEKERCEQETAQMKTSMEGMLQERQREVMYTDSPYLEM